MLIKLGSLIDPDAKRNLYWPLILYIVKNLRSPWLFVSLGWTWVWLQQQATARLRHHSPFWKTPNLTNCPRPAIHLCQEVSATKKICLILINTDNWTLPARWQRQVKDHVPDLKEQPKLFEEKTFDHLLWREKLHIADKYLGPLSKYFLKVSNRNLLWYEASIFRWYWTEGSRFHLAASNGS